MNTIFIEIDESLPLFDAHDRLDIILIKRLLDKNYSIREIAKTLRVSHETIYARMRRLGLKANNYRRSNAVY